MSMGAGLGTGSLSTPSGAGMSAADSPAPRSRRYRPGRPRRYHFPVAHARHGVSAPGFFHSDLQGPFRRDPPRPLPARDAGRPARGVPRRGSSRPARNVDTDLENDLLVRAEADDLGDLKALRLGEARFPIWPRWVNGSAAIPSYWRGGRSGSGWSPTMVCATSRPRGSSPPVRPLALPRSGSPSLVPRHLCPAAEPSHAESVRAAAIPLSGGP